MAEVCVIYNPEAGRGQDRTVVNRMRRVLREQAEFRPTREPGHACDLARQAADAGFRVVAAAGGDGTVHEVTNGLLQARKQAILAVIPTGSANDFAYSLRLGRADWWLRPDPSISVRHTDVGMVRAAGRTRYFVNCLGVGFNGAATLEARKIRNLRGIPLYALALIRALRSHYEAPILAIRLDGSEEQRVPTLSLTLGIGEREGNFLLTPRAILDDGLFDYLHVGRLGRLRLLSYVPRMIRGRIPDNDPVIGQGRCRSVAIRSEMPLIVHTDGEFFCLPHEGVKELEIELIPGRLPVLGRITVL
jgi:diacylglycerol kinase (ATP)